MLEPTRHAKSNTQSSTLPILDSSSRCTRDQQSPAEETYAPRATYDTRSTFSTCTHKENAAISPIAPPEPLTQAITRPGPAASLLSQEILLNLVPWFKHKSWCWLSASWVATTLSPSHCSVIPMRERGHWHMFITTSGGAQCGKKVGAHQIQR